jgi:LuxR family quorum-sensing system transcriptional regulator CciR
MDAGQVEEFTAAFAAAPDHRAVAELLGHAARALGFDHVALVHHSGAPEGEAGLALVDYPEAWRRSLGARRSFADDPVLVMSERRIAGFLWSELEQLMPLSERQREVLAIAAACGLAEGFTVPLHAPGSRLASCSFALGPGRSVPRGACIAAHVLACAACEALRRLAGPELAPAPPGLTGRQFDCLALAAQGKSDWHIGQLLGISADTVHQHIEAAKRRYGVASRIQLAVRALSEGQIAFGDVLSPGRTTEG